MDESTETEQGGEGAAPVVRVVLLVIMLLVVGVVVAGPNLLDHPHHQHGDAHAIGALKAISNAQLLYREGDKDGNGTLEYAPTLRALVKTGPAKNEDLIDEVLASGEKMGYRYSLQRAPGEAAQFVWFARADPIEPGVTGMRWFGINHTGAVFHSETGPIRFDPKDATSPDSVLGQ